MRMRIGPYDIAPAWSSRRWPGVTDKPFRVLCKRLGAGLCVSEMTTSDPRFWNTAKSRHRMDHDGEPAPISVQIAGTVPGVLAEAARYNVDHGAQIIDINMGCPAKKVCNAWAGSALMRDEALVARILEAVVDAVDVPVTLKIRTGWAADQRNALTIARIAEDCRHRRAGRARPHARPAVHRSSPNTTRSPTIKSRAVASPCSPTATSIRRTRRRSCSRTPAADAVMIGRAAQGRPWIFREIAHYLATGEPLPPPSLREVRDILLGHLEHLHAFYGERFRRAHRAQASGLVCQGSSGERGLPRRGQPGRDRGSAVAADPRLLRRTGCRALRRNCLQSLEQAFAGCYPSLSLAHGQFHDIRAEKQAAQLLNVNSSGSRSRPSASC